MYSLFVGTLAAILVVLGIFYIFVLPLIRKVHKFLIWKTIMWRYFFKNVRYCWSNRWVNYQTGGLLDLVLEEQKMRNLESQLETIRQKTHGRKGNQFTFATDLFDAPKLNGAKRIISLGNGKKAYVSEKDWHKIFVEQKHYVKRQKNVWSSKQKQMIKSWENVWLTNQEIEKGLADKTVVEFKDYVAAGIYEVIKHEPVY